MNYKFGGMKEELEDLAEFGKKRNTDHDFPPPFMWAENNKYNG